ncbi:MAG: hypothetical protein KBH53_00590, partial [Methanoculleus sp.]|nr:hypothetical protein [Methanoculleus sp.]
GHTLSTRVHITLLAFCSTKTGLGGVTEMEEDKNPKSRNRLKTAGIIVVLDGDGSLLGTAVLPVVAAEAPKNLTIVCLDNGAFGSTGNQPTPASGLVDMELLARAAGIRNTCKVQDEEELEEAWESRGRGPNFIHVVLNPGNAPVGNIPLAPAEIRERFVRALGR